MKQVTGYLSNDGTFHEDEQSARLHETKMGLEDVLNQYLAPVIVDRVFSILENPLNTQALGDYFHAFQEWIKASPVHNPANNVSDEELEAILQQQAGGRELVSDVGSGVESETVSILRPEHGTGVRGVDASSVRSGEGVATASHTEVAQTRQGRGRKNPR